MFVSIQLCETVNSHQLDYKEVKAVNPKGNQPWIFTGRSEAEALILWPPDNKEPTHYKRPWYIEGKHWRQEENGATEDEMVGWHHQLKGHESEQSPGVGEEQGSLAWRSPWGRKESNTTEWLNWTEPNGSLTCWLQWAGYRYVSFHHCSMVWGMSHATVAWFCY